MRVGEHYEAAASRYDPGRTVVLGNEMGALTLAEQYNLPWIQMIVSPGYMKSGHEPCHPDRVLPATLRWLARTPRGMRLLWRLNTLRGGRPAPTRDPNRPVIFPPNHPLMPVREKAGLLATMSLRARVSLCARPDWFAAPQPDWPDHAHTTGFLLPPGAVAMSSLTAGPEQPGNGARPIVVTTGSTASSQNQLFAAAIEVCRRLKRPGHLVTPVRDQVPVDLPPEVTYSAHVPFESLFPWAALVVHHGGIGTGALALAAGVPQLLCPMRGDQFDNSNRLQRLGVGKMVDARRITPDGLTLDVLGLLGSAAVARQRTHCAIKGSTEDGPKRSADLVESVFESGAGRVALRADRLALADQL
jgi:rhamnosyltransferase subunit B